MSKKEKWVFRFNTQGCMPDSEPDLYESQDEAKRACIHELKRAEDLADSEEIAEELCHLAEAVNLENGEFAFYAPDGYFYCVEKI